MKALQTSRNYHCTCHPQSSGKVKRTNKILKLKISKLAKTTDFPVLPFIFLTVHGSSVGNKLTPHETVTSDQCLLVHGLLLMPWLMLM